MNRQLCVELGSNRGERRMHGRMGRQPLILNAASGKTSHASSTRTTLAYSSPPFPKGYYLTLARLKSTLPATNGNGKRAVPRPDRESVDNNSVDDVPTLRDREDDGNLFSLSKIPYGNCREGSDPQSADQTGEHADMQTHRPFDACVLWWVARFNLLCVCRDSQRVHELIISGPVGEDTKYGGRLTSHWQLSRQVRSKALPVPAG
ncbi:hypothetical protein VTI74DRAFT_2363 [Chaetomium olivicolor]